MAADEPRKFCVATSAVVAELPVLAAYDAEALPTLVGTSESCLLIASIATKLFLNRLRPWRIRKEFGLLGGPSAQSMGLYLRSSRHFFDSSHLDCAELIIDLIILLSG